ncbi:myeloid differentiation primary response protein MyD88-like [Linepithema humile]|uniref:myeloid differentiation primary response protein MyD88-like n=1 Tax=Linepithema humile TaxID=83485 RepID=UPI0006235FE7|nr:PREDICTED: myeloid differentiation primary response protein MyD88-like [Linepithema humile]
MASDLSAVPLVALSAETKEYIANMLNPTKFLSNENSFQRDWRGLTHLLKVNAELMPWFEAQKDPTKYILEKIEKNISMKDFQATMELMDRWDIIDDTEKMFESDAIKYLEHQQRVSANPIDQQVDEDILTLDDAYRLTRGLSKTHYDAFLLYADEDADFANEIMQKLQTEYKLKLCYHQNMIAGLPFEHEAVMKLISKRCNKLLVILSPNFLRHPTNQFLLSYTQALSIEKQQRKIVPCLYKKCQQEDVPYQLQYISRVDYTRRKYQDFWMLLCYSIQAPTVVITSSTMSVEQSSMIQELPEINTLPDKHSIIIETATQKTDEETSRHSLQSESCVNRDGIALNVENEENEKLLLKKMKNLKTKLNGDSLESNESGESQNQLITCTKTYAKKKKSSDKKKSSLKFFRKKKIALQAS